MKECENCHASLASLARFCGQCGQSTGFDLPVLKEAAKIPLIDKINPSKKRKGLAIFSFVLFVLLVVSCVVFLVISFLVAENFAGALFIVALIALLFYFQARFTHLERLLARETKNRCLNCGYRYLDNERFCEQCGAKLV